MIQKNSEAFLKNPVIQKLSTQHVWTINNPDPHAFPKANDPLKVPIDPYAYLNGEIHGFSKQSQHATLNELAVIPDTERALICNTLATHVLPIDLEAKTVKNQKDGGLCQEIFEHIQQDCYANYVEQSKHGGEHRLLEIPDSLLNDPDYQIIFNTDVIKLPEKTLELFPGGNHHMTLTEKVIPYQLADTHSRAYEDAVARFLDFIKPYVKIKHQRTIDLHQVKVDQDFVNEMIAYMEPKFNFDTLFDHFQNALDDRSRFDYKVICSIFSRLDTEYQALAHNSLVHGIIRHFNEDPSVNDMIAIVRQIFLDFCDTEDLMRDKFFEERNDTDWLSYCIQNAYCNLNIHYREK